MSSHQNGYNVLAVSCSASRTSGSKTQKSVPDPLLLEKYRMQCRGKDCKVTAVELLESVNSPEIFYVFDPVAVSARLSCVMLIYWHDNMVRKAL